MEFSTVTSMCRHFPRHDSMDCGPTCLSFKKIHISYFIIQKIIVSLSPLYVTADEKKCGS